jgi:hypothetical protein
VAHYLSHQSGGIYLYGKEGHYAGALEAIIAAVHSRYQLSFVPPVRDGKRHKLQVRLANPQMQRDALILSRTEYVPGE